MSLNSTDKGLLTPGNCAVLFIDHQPQMFFGVANMPMKRLASPDETAETIVFTNPTD